METKLANKIFDYFQDKEQTANKYVLHCYTVTMLVYTISLILNLFGIFIIEKTIMNRGYFICLVIYILTMIITRYLSFSNVKTKYITLFAIILTFSIMGIHVTYHVIMLGVLPFLYAVLYSSKKVMVYTYILSVISTFFVVYGGYYWGLCDANMVLLTCGPLQDYIVDGHFALNEINTNPTLSLGLYYAFPRCLIYIVFVTVCNSIFSIVSGSFEKIQLTNELEQAKLTAEQANRAKSDFLAKVSHEVRTPINAVLGMNEMILRECRDDKMKEYATDIKSSANNLLNIINDILDASKIESGKMEIIPVEYDISNILNDLYNMFQIKAKENNLELNFEVDSTIPIGYMGDDVRIRQILSNLLSNAIKYTKQGSVTFVLTGKTEDGRAKLSFRVKDTGLGIKDEDIDKLFSAYERMDKRENHYVEGTGLGLPITVQLLKLMGSELKVTSEYGKGSEFYFDIEQEIVNSEPLNNFRDRRQQPTQQEEYKENYYAPNARILVVDDNMINRKVFMQLLKDTRIQIDDAASGQEGLELVAQDRYDIIFLDHMMPEMDGIETLARMKEQKFCQDVPIVMLTANALVGAKEQYMEQGFDDFLSKPIVLKELHRIILQYLPKELVKFKQYNRS